MKPDRLLLWLILAAPLVILTFRYDRGIVYYGEYLHWTGLQATRLLIVTLAITTARLAFPRSRIALWLLRHRRDLGLLTFCYAFAHTVAYLTYKQDVALIGTEAVELGMATGWVAMVLMTILALTSNNISVHKLGRRWKTVHRSVYAGAALTFAHWVLTAFDPTAGYLHLAALIALYAARMLLTMLARARTGKPAGRQTAEEKRNAPG